MTDGISPIRTPRWRRVVASQQTVLLFLLTVQIAIFSVTGTHFLSTDNAFETLRGTLEVALLAVALTPVIVTGGIDLSVGSLMGLTAILFGKLWRDAGWPVWPAAGGALAVGALGGLVNGLLITRLRINPLIVTLGSFSLFRGLAEGITSAVDNFTNFPEQFTFIGQGYLGGTIPVQLFLLVVTAVFFWSMLHRMTIGRTLIAIGFSPEGARHAGIPVERRLTLVYVLSGLVSAIAGVLYVAHWGQAKADAGTGYELLAITAVVLGGTSIFGGRGSVTGSLLGWLTIAVLQQGLTLSDLPKELAGILTGLLLIFAILINQLLAAFATRAPRAQFAAGQLASEQGATS